MGRRAWLFSNSVKGAEASAAAFSLIETAKANHLDPYDYIGLSTLFWTISM
ncbi:transposase domain-containing protein [[Clostridium] spiroforme]|nr:transposase domain-containing protein [Thomasclavelia spiroformis]MBM6881213.1 transposase domain-containing protein [Thomasclavelia spiroformis]